MAVMHHTGDAEVEFAARPHVRQEALVEVARVAPVIVVRVDAHHGIEEPRAKRQPAGGVGLHGMDRRHGDSERIEERAVLGRVAPQLDGVHVEAVLAGKKRARNPGSTA